VVPSCTSTNQKNMEERAPTTDPPAGLGDTPTAPVVELEPALTSGTPVRDPRSLTHELLRNLAASTVAGFTSATVTSPMDVLRTRLQAQRPGAERYASLAHAASTVFRSEGPRGFYKGLAPMLLGDVLPDLCRGEGRPRCARLGRERCVQRGWGGSCF
jgi:hypothetical protein